MRISDVSSDVCSSDLALPVPPVLPAELPSALLERRPDVRGAERRLAAANAEIGIARAAYFPRLSLTALLGLESLEIDSLFGSGTGTWQAVGGAAAPLFDFGRTEANVRAAAARREQALAEYRATVRNSFREGRSEERRVGKEGVSRCRSR